MPYRHAVDLALVVELDRLFPGGWSPEGIKALLDDILDNED